MELTGENVEKIFLECLYKNEELPATQKDREEFAKKHGVHAEGIQIKTVFNPTRINKYKDDVKDMVGQLPDTFDDGWSFLNMCVTKDGKEWTSLHRTMEQLCCLGTATGALKLLSPREMWPVLPGGMPYYRRVKS